MNRKVVGVDLKPGDWVKITSDSLLISVPEPISFDYDGKPIGKPMTIFKADNTYAKFLGSAGDTLHFKIKNEQWQTDGYSIKFTRVSKKEYKSLEVLYGG